MFSFKNDFAQPELHKQETAKNGLNNFLRRLMELINLPKPLMPDGWPEYQKLLKPIF